MFRFWAEAKGEAHSHPEWSLHGLVLAECVYVLMTGLAAAAEHLLTKDLAPAGLATTSSPRLPLSCF